MHTDANVLVTPLFVLHSGSTRNEDVHFTAGAGPASTLSPSFVLAQAIFEPNLFPYEYSNILKPNHSSYLSAYEDGTECSGTSGYKIQTPENYSEESKQLVDLYWEVSGSKLSWDGCYPNRSSLWFFRGSSR